MTQITWFARLVTSDGAPSANVGVQLQIFDLKEGWKGIGTATTGADGRIRATAGDAGPAAGPAPMLRLLETDAAPAVLGGVPTVTAGGSPPALTCDFGEIVHIPDRFTVARAAPVRMTTLRATDVAGVAAPAAAARADIGSAIAGAALSRGTDTSDLQARLSAREADLSRLQADRDGIAGQLATRTAELQKLQTDTGALRTDLDARSAALKTAQAERDDARTQLAARATDIQKLQADRDGVAGQLAARTADIQKLQADNGAIRTDLDTRTKALATAQAERDDARTQLATRSADVQKLQSDLDARTAAIKAVQAERDDARSQVAARTADLATAQADAAAVRAQAGTGSTALRAALAERDDVRLQLAARETDVSKLQLERDNIQAQLADSEKRLAHIRAAGTAAGAATANGASAKVSVGVFATRLGGEIDSAQAALKDRGFSLGPISVTARALVDDGGSQITFPGVEAMKTIPAAALSDIAIQYHPSPAADAAGTGVQVPDVRQLTESAARRVLASIGLALEVTQGPHAIDPTCAVGQVMLQSPQAGDRAARGTRVIAIFAGADG